MRSPSWVKAAIVLWVASGLTLGAQELPERFSGRIVDAGGAVPGRSSAFFQVEIKEYTADREIPRLASVLARQGPRALRLELEKLDVGWVRIGSRLGYPLSVARSFETEDGGRIVRLATDRPVAMFEALNALRSMDYPFGFIELQLDAQGRGQGRLIAAAELSFGRDGQLVIESFGLEPFRILRAELDQPKKKRKKERRQE